MTIPKRCEKCRRRLFDGEYHICEREDAPKPKPPRKNTTGELRPRRPLSAQWIDE